MRDVQLIPGQHIHLVGIGGVGLSAIARVLLAQGFYISGSDRSRNALTDALARDGAVIYEGHDPAHVKGAELVIISSAVPPDHVEVVAALRQHVPVLKRSDIIAAVMSGQQGIAIAGTHGKTTTTAMVTHILLETGQRPSYIIGGVLRTTGQNAGIGMGRAFVIEADEYDNMFHGLRPHTAVLTSAEWDHPDFFPTPADMARSFARFVHLLPRDGLLIACADDPLALIFAQNRLISHWPVETYAVAHAEATWRAADLRQERGQTTAFDVVYEGRPLGVAHLAVPGQHNVLNALAAFAVAHSQGVPFADAARALQSFQGAGRRFDLMGEISEVAVINDYAHHPTAIRATLQAARQRYPGRQVWAVWQPHTYSRTQKLLEGYTAAFHDADQVIVTEVYAAREQPVPGVSGAEVAAAFTRAGVHFAPSFADAVRLLVANVQPPAVVIIMSAGDAPRIGEDYLRLLESSLSPRNESSGVFR